MNQEQQAELVEEIVLSDYESMEREYYKTYSKVLNEKNPDIYYTL